MALKSSMLGTAALVITASAVVAHASAYEYPFSPESIRQAYFVGSSRNGKTTELTGPYAHRFPVPPSGPNIAEIQVKTPFEQIVERAGQATNYTAQDATQEFLNKPAVLRVLVKIYFTP